MLNIQKAHIAVIGLGYVGLPLACTFADKFPVIGYDVNTTKSRQLAAGHVSPSIYGEEALQRALNCGQLKIADDISETATCNVYVIAVPTPADANHHADPSLLLTACGMVGKLISKGDVVVVESTIAPGMTERLLIPRLEEASALKCNRDFTVGYSPERINPGDQEHTVKKICKIVSGSTPETADFLEQLYGSVITAGTYKATSISVAEASKMMENSQRDALIAFINEMQQVFTAMGIDIKEVMKAAATKWDYIPMHPGLVGGHCIPVDPYYLIDEAARYHVPTPMLSTARKVNNGMATWYAERIREAATRRGGNKVLLLGFAFKPDCEDLRNTLVADVFRELCRWGFSVTVYDPLVDARRVQDIYHINVEKHVPPLDDYAVVAECTPHTCFHDLEQCPAVQSRLVKLY